MHLLLLAFVERVGDNLSLHTVEVPGNVGPCERPDNSFDAEVVLTSGCGLPSFDFVANSENVLWIRAFPSAVSSRAFASAVSPSGCNVAQVDVEIMVVKVDLGDQHLLFAPVSVLVCFSCLTLWDCPSQIFHTCDKLVWHVYP